MKSEEIQAIVKQMRDIRSQLSKISIAVSDIVYKLLEIAREQDKTDAEGGT